MGLSEKGKVSGGISIFEISLGLFIVLVVIIGLAIVGAIVFFAIKKPKPTSPGEAFEEALQELELTGIKGIGSKRAEELKAAGVNTISDLAASSTKDLSQKTGISEKIVSRWIEESREIIEQNLLTYKQLRVCMSYPTAMIYFLYSATSSSVVT